MVNRNRRLLRGPLTIAGGGGGGDPPPEPEEIYTFTPPVPTEPTYLLLNQVDTVNNVLLNFDWGLWADPEHATPHLVSYRIDGGAYTSEVGVSPGDIITITGGLATNVVDVRVRAKNATGTSVSYRTATITLGALGSSYYLAPAAAGSADGSSYANAKAYSAANLSTAITSVGANGTVYLVADQGNYSLTSSQAITTAGSAQHPVTITGVSSTGTGFPDATSTGYRAGTTLAASGSITTSSDGQIISAKDITGRITVNHNNVTIRDCKITMNDFFGISISSGKSGCLIEYVEINGARNYTAILTGASTTVRYCNIYACENAIATNADGLTVTACYIHDFDADNVDPHYDGIEHNGYDDLIVQGCTIHMPEETGAVNVTNYSNSPVDNVLIDGNYLTGGSNTIIVDDNFGAANITNVVISNNQIFPTSPGTEYLFRGGAANVGVTTSNNTILTDFLTGGGGTTEGPAVVTIIGSRTDWTPPADADTVTDTSLWTVGNQLFRPNGSSGHLRFKNITFKNLGNGAIAPSAACSNIIVQDCTVQNVQRFIETANGAITGLVVKDMTAVGYAKQCMRLTSTTNKVLVVDCDLDSRRQDNDSGGGLPVGVQCDGTANYVTCLRVNASNSHYSFSSDESQYWNGDGFEANDNNYGLRYILCTAQGCTDGGWDIKTGTGAGDWTATYNTLIYSCTATDNKRNFRTWGDDGDIDRWRCVSNEPFRRGGTGGACHLMLRNNSDVWDRECEFNDTSGATVYLSEDANASVLRVTDPTYNTLSGTYSTSFSGTTQFWPNVNPDPEDDAPAFDMTADYTMDENDTLTIDVEYTGENCLVRAFPTAQRDTAVAFNMGVVADNVQAASTVVLAAPDYEAPTDELNAPTNEYEINLRVRDPARREDNITLTIAVNDVPGDTGGTVDEGADFYFRWNNTDKASSALVLSGSEKKTVTKSGSAGYTNIRGTEAFWAPLHSQGYFEFVVGAFTTATEFGVGLGNLSQSLTAKGGSSLHGVSYRPNGQVVLGGVTLTTLGTYSAGDTIRVAIAETGLGLSAKNRSVRFAVNGGSLSTAIEIGNAGIVDALYPMAFLYDNADAVTIKSAASEWSYSAPVGHSAFGGVNQYEVTGNSSRYVASNTAGRGTKNGSSWANAAPFQNLNNMIAAAGPGGIVFIEADVAAISYSSTLTINRGGTSGNPVTIVGVTQDLIPHPVRISGNRTAWTLPENPETQTSTNSEITVNGSELLRLTTGADYLTFDHFHFSRFEWSIRLYRTLTDFTLKNSTFYNCRRGFVDCYDTNDGTSIAYADGSPVNVVIEKCHGVGHSKPAIDLRGTANNWTVTDVRLNSGRQVRDDAPVGMKIEERAHDLTCTRIWCYNNDNGVTGSEYTQGDGFESNSGNYNVSYTDCAAWGCTDGGWDVKAANTTFDSCVAFDNKRNYRLWGIPSDESGTTGGAAQTLTDCISGDYASRPANGSSGHIFVCSVSTSTTSFGRANILCRNFTFNEAVAGTGIIVNFAETSNLIRLIDSNLVSAGVTTALGSVSSTRFSTAGGCRVIRTTSADVTAPTITSSNTGSAYSGQTFSRTLTASEAGSWYITGGAQAANFQVVNSHADTATLQFLNNGGAVYDAAGDNTWEIKLKFRDSAYNVSAEQTVTVTISADYTFSDSDASALNTRYASAGRTLDNTERARLDTQIAGLKATGLVGAGMTSSTIHVIQDYRLGLLNWMSASNYVATLGGSPALVATGRTTDGVDDYINTNWNPTSAGVTQNSAFHAVHLKTITNGATNAGAFSAATNTMSITAHNGAASPRSTVATNGQALTSSGTVGAGFYWAGRTGATSPFLSRNGGNLSITGGSTAVSAGVPNANYEIGRYNGVYTALTVAMFVGGVGITQTQANSLNSILSY